MRAVARHGLVGKATLLARLSATRLPQEQAARITHQIDADFAS